MPSNSQIAMYAGSFLLLTTCILLVAAAGSRNVIKSNELYSMSFFQICVTGLGCDSISANCGTSNSQNDFTGKCSEFNAARGLLVLAILVLVFALLIAIFVCVKKSERAGHVVVILSIIAVFCGIIAMACAFDLFDSTVRGASVELLAAAWPLGFLGAFVYAYGNKSSGYSTF